MERLDLLGEPKIVLTAPDEPIVLKGFFVSVSLPSEGLFQRRFSDKEEIIQEVKKEFDLIRQDLISGFKALRTRVYAKILPQYTIKIQHLGNRAVYFLPLPEAEEFLLTFEDLKKEYAVLQMKIDEYLRVDDDTQWLDKVKEYTVKKRIRGIEPCPNLPNRVRVSLTPIEINPYTFDSFLSDHPEVKAELSRVRAQLEDDYRETVDKIVQDLETRLSSVVMRLSNAVRSTYISKNNVELARNALAELESITASANLDSIMGTSLKHASMLIEAMMMDENISDQFVDSAKDFAESLGYDVGDDFNPRSLLANISFNMEQDMSPRVKALMNEIL